MTRTLDDSLNEGREGSPHIPMGFSMLGRTTAGWEFTAVCIEFAAAGLGRLRGAGSYGVLLSVQSEAGVTGGAVAPNCGTPG